MIRKLSRDESLSESLQYSIFDPTGNITALVESRVDRTVQPSVAARIMALHPEVEQVGFVDFGLPADRMKEGDPGETVRGELRMAGGEFCGNASMSAAALYLLRKNQKRDMPVTVRLHVSGAGQPVEVCMKRTGADSFDAGIHMPPSLGIEVEQFTFNKTCGPLPVVRMKGISHIIIEQDSAFWELLGDKTAAEKAVRRWCKALSADGLGLMFLKGSGLSLSLTPLVYVPGSQTVFWENSCASGSSAAGMYLSDKRDTSIDLTLMEPGGSLRVNSDLMTGDTWLYGSTRFLGHYEFPGKPEE